MSIGLGDLEQYAPFDYAQGDRQTERSRSLSL